MPSVGPYWSARADASAATRAISAARSSAGNVLVSGSPPASEITSGPRGDRHEVAHGGGLHALGAAREQPGVALEVARGGPRRPMPGDSPPEPGPLGVSSIVMPPRAPLARMDFILDLLQGAGIAAAIGIRPFLPVLLAGALGVARTSGIDFDGHRLRFLEDWPFLLGMLVARRRGSTSSARRAGRDAADRAAAALRPRWPSRSCSGAAGRRLGRRPLRRLVGRADRRRRLRRAGLPGRALAVRPRAPPTRRRRRPNALPVYARGRRARRRRAVDPVPAARRARDRRARLAARRRAPAERREVRRPAHPALSAVADRKKLVLAVIDAMKPAMLERAVAAGRAPALGLLMERGHHVERLRRRVPLGHAGLLGVDRHRHGARPPPHPVDELVPPRRGALRRVRDELQGLAGLRLQALAHGHDLQHERRAPLRRDADGVRDARRRRTSARPARPTSCTAAGTGTR